jgi:ankyrin repeat protein
VNATTTTRKTPLHMAATGGPNFNPARHLTPRDPEAEAAAAAAAEAEAEVAGGEGGLHLSASRRSLAGDGASEDGNAGMITLLVRLGADIEHVDLEGGTPIIAAAKRGNHLGVDTLLNLDARIYAQNIRGHTALHVAAFAHHIPVVRQLVRWDAEVGKLKHVLDDSGRNAYDMGADPPTRDALHTLFEACASGRQDLVQAVARAGAALPPSSYAPWLPVRLWETTRVLGRNCLHATITGAARAMAEWRTAEATKSAAARALGGKPGSRAGVIPPPPAKTYLGDRKPSPSAVHLVAGLGLRFVPVPSPQEPGAGLPDAAYMAWGGRPADVRLSFPDPPSARVQQYVDQTAYVPKPNAHLAGMQASRAGDGSRSALAAQRVLPGTELTSVQAEKEFGRVLEWLLRAGMDANGADHDGVTPLMLAAKYGLLYLLRRLLTHGADARVADRESNTALHWAHAFLQPAAAGIIEELAGGAGSAAAEALRGAANAAGRTPAEVEGAGVSILPDCGERLLVIRRPPPRSASLSVTGAQ